MEEKQVTVVDYSAFESGLVSIFVPDMYHPEGGTLEVVDRSPPSEESVDLGDEQPH